MAEDIGKFDKRFKAFDEAGKAEDWDKAIKLGEALRTYTGLLFALLIFAAPFLWFYVSGKIGKNGPECTETNCNDLSFIKKHISISVTTILLLSPLMADLSYCNRNARIERHTLEDYDRICIMLFLSDPEGAHIEKLMEHFNKRGTPEVLNKHYHPKQASKPPDNTSILKRIESLLSKTPLKEEIDV